MPKSYKVVSIRSTVDDFFFLRLKFYHLSKSFLFFYIFQHLWIKIYKFLNKKVAKKKNERIKGKYWPKKLNVLLNNNISYLLLDNRQRPCNRMYDAKAQTEDKIEKWQRKCTREEDLM